MLALDFFSLIHVPINVPALAASTKKDDLNMDRELYAHGISNVVSGLLGSVQACPASLDTACIADPTQNYLVYTNSLLFIRSGASSRVTGVLLALATVAVLFVFPSIIGLIPIFVVSTLIFSLGFDLLREAVIEPWSNLSIVEYLTVRIRVN